MSDYEPTPQIERRVLMMVTNSKILWALGIVAICVLAQDASAAQLQYNYTYTGNSFTQTTGVYNNAGGTNHLIIEFTLLNPIPPNLPLQSSLHSEVSSFRIIAGPDTIDVLAAYMSGAVLAGFDPIAGLPLGWFATDSGGNITQWNMGVNIGINGDTYEYQYYSNNSPLYIVMDLASQGLMSQQNWDGYTPFPNNEARAMSNPGTWTLAVTSNVPEPGTALLLLAPLCLLLALRGISRRDRA